MKTNQPYFYCNLNGFFLFLFLLNSCSSDVKDIPVIDPVKVIEKDISLSDISSEISYIPLSNDILFNGIVSIEYTDSLIFLYPANGGLFAYDYEGNLLRSVGKKGKGPGEYIFGYRFTLDRQTEKVFILDKERILKYSFKGQYLNHISLEKFPENNFNWVIFSNGRLFLYEGINYGYGAYDWVVLDTTGNILLTKPNPIEQFSSAHSCSGSKQEAFNNTLYYWNQINDTIFKINERGYTAAYLFSQGEFRFPKQPVKSISTEYFYPRKILFTRNYLFFSINYQFRNCTGIYNISEQQLYIVGKSNELTSPLGPGINNNFDGGVPFIPLSYYMNNTNEEFLIGEINPYELKAHVASDAFRNSAPKFPDKKKELERLAGSLNENDNPVLMIVRLKE